MIKAGAVTFEVTTVKNGEKIILNMKSNPVTTAVKPVFPPIAIPAEDST